MPERLLELYAALRNDPLVIRECLARPVLVDRLSRNFFAFDESIHAEAKRTAESLRRRLAGGELSSLVEVPHRTIEELAMDGADRSKPEAAWTPNGILAPRRSLSAKEFRERRARLPRNPGEVSPFHEARSDFSVSVVLSESDTSARVAWYRTPKRTWDDWWQSHGPTLDASSPGVAGVDGADRLALDGFIRRRRARGAFGCSRRHLG
jgi:hypothetical protein